MVLSPKAINQLVKQIAPNIAGQLAPQIQTSFADAVAMINPINMLASVLQPCLQNLAYSLSTSLK